MSPTISSAYEALDSLSRQVLNSTVVVNKERGGYKITNGRGDFRYLTFMESLAWRTLGLLPVFIK